MVQKASPKLTELMNQAIGGELQAIVQYMWHHIMIKGLNSASLSDVFEDIAVEEMKHAEKIAERLFYFDVSPTTKPNPIAVGGDTTQMLKADVKAEEEAIRKVLAGAKREGAQRPLKLEQSEQFRLFKNDGHHFSLLLTKLLKDTYDDLI